MIYITGDTHGQLSLLLARCKPDGSELTSDDKLIICGDFGFVLSSKYENGAFKDDAMLDYIAEYVPCQILFVSGNHENFDRLGAYPDTELYGGVAKEIRRDKIYLLKRGEAYTIEGKTVFTFGGAYSIDRSLRKEGVSWWRQELPSAEEYHHASETLRKHRFHFDYIITHTCPTRITYLIATRPDFHEAELNGFLDWIYTEVQFRHWYFGHWHLDKTFYDGITTACFEAVHKLDDNGPPALPAGDRQE